MRRATAGISPTLLIGLAFTRDGVTGIEVKTALEMQAALDAAPHEDPDILAGLARSPRHPTLLTSFAAETEHVIDDATAKRARKDVDWIVTNDESGDVMGGATNTVHIVTASGVETGSECRRRRLTRSLPSGSRLRLGGPAPRSVRRSEF